MTLNLDDTSTRSLFSLSLSITTSLDLSKRAAWSGWATRKLDDRIIDGVGVKYNGAAQDSFMQITELVSTLGKEDFHMAKLHHNITRVNEQLVEQCDEGDSCHGRDHLPL